MDPSFFGTWELDPSKTTGADELGKVLGLSTEQIEQYKKLSYTLSINPEGNGYKMVLSFKADIPNATQTYQVIPGQELDYTTLEGDAGKMTLNIEGKKVLETHKVPSKGWTTSVTRTVSGKVMTVMTKSGGVTASVILNKV